MGRYTTWGVSMTKNKNILIKNIYYMLVYAFQKVERFEDILSGTEAFDNIQNLFAAILSNELSYQIKRGLYQEYVNKTENIYKIRGRIDISGTMQNKIIRKNIISCRFDELSADNIFNRIIKSAMLLLLRHTDVANKYKDKLKKELLYFSGVSGIELKKINWSHIHFERNNYSYKFLIIICQLIAENMLMTTDDGNYKLANFFDGKHINKLYEKFILGYYRREHPGINASAAKIPWVIDDGNNGLLPEMHTDITLQNKKGDVVLIIDAKFYSHTMQEHFNVISQKSNNIYQIFTYVKNKDYAFGNIPHVVSGMLLYARTDEEIQPDNTYQMSGNKISIKTLDLNKDFSEIRKQLDTIIYNHFYKLGGN